MWFVDTHTKLKQALTGEFESILNSPETFKESSERAL